MKNFNIKIPNLLFYLLILFLPTQFGKHFFPAFSFVSGVRVDYLSPTLYLTDILVLFLFIFWIFSKGKFSIFNFQFLIKSKFKNFNFSNISNSFQISNFKFQIGLLATIVLIGIFFSNNQAVGWYGLLKLVEFVFLGFYIAGNIKKLNLGIVLFMLSAGILLESFLAIFQYVNQGSIDGIFYFFGERTFSSMTPGIANASINGELVLRPYGTFSHPNVLAGFLVIAMTLISSKLKVKSSKFRKSITMVSLVVGTVALLLTMSRIAILIWLFILLTLVFIKTKKYFKNKFIIYYLLFIILIVGSIFWLSPLRFRFFDIKTTDESVVKRQELINDSFTMIKSNPIFGVGLNNFLVELPSVHKQTNNVFYLQPVHNIYLLILTQTGMIGLAFFTWFIFKTFKRLKFENSFHPDRIGIKFQILFIALALGLFDHYFLTLQQGQLLFSFALGFCWSNERGNSS